MGQFYQARNIKQVTEDQLMQGEESLSFVEPDLSPDQAEVLRNSASNVPEFKNKMAKQVLKAITHKPQKFEQIPSLLVATSFGGDF